MKHSLHILVRQTRARLRLVVSLALGVALFMILPASWPSTFTTRLLLCWNAAVLLYLVKTGWVIATASMDSMRQRAYRQDEGQKTILLLTAATVLASLVAIVAELGTIKAMTGTEKCCT